MRHTARYWGFDSLRYRHKFDNINLSMIEVRYPNSECKRCQKPIYRRPAEIERYKNGVFCGRDCFHLETWGRLPREQVISCRICKKQFQRTHSNRNAFYCSRSCSNKGRKGTKYIGLNAGNASQQRLAALKERFGFSRCMVEGCYYDKTFDVHRFVPGRSGGLYKIGNMFAICPNHHAEHTRGLIEFVKLDDSSLRVLNIK